MCQKKNLNHKRGPGFRAFYDWNRERPNVFILKTLVSLNVFFLKAISIILIASSTVESVQTFFIFFFDIKWSVDDNQKEPKDKRLRDKQLQSSLIYISDEISMSLIFFALQVETRNAFSSAKSLFLEKLFDTQEIVLYSNLWYRLCDLH